MCAHLDKPHPPLSIHCNSPWICKGRRNLEFTKLQARRVELSDFVFVGLREPDNARFVDGYAPGIRVWRGDRESPQAGTAKIKAVYLVIIGREEPHHAVMVDQQVIGFHICLALSTYTAGKRMLVKGTGGGIELP